MPNKTGISIAKRPYKTPHGKTVKLTDRQKQWADAALDSKTAGELIRKTQEIHETDYDSARQIVLENFQKPSLSDYLNDSVSEAQSIQLSVMRKASKSKSVGWQRLASDTAERIQDRVLGKPKQSVDVTTTSVNVSINLTGEQ